MDRALGKDGIYRWASISPCKQYRYWLRQYWGGGDKEYVCFVMLNPSTGTEKEDDHTIRRCRAFAQAWGYYGMVILNLFALRSRWPDTLLIHDDPIGPNNKKQLQLWSESGLSDKVVLAWGNGPIVDKLIERYRPQNLLSGMRAEKLHYLKLNADGHPAHPLYLKGDLVPQKYDLPRHILGPHDIVI